MSGSEACACGTCATCAAPKARPPVADPVMFRHGAIKQRLLARIGDVQIDGRRPLADLGTRDDDDPAIALIDAVAGGLHVLAWNTARLHDDGTLRRTEDRDAMVDLTGLLGYTPRPALAATTTLAFTLDTLEGSPKVATIPKGLKVASIPGQDELPQTFETDAALEAKAEWNRLAPVLSPNPQGVSATTSVLVLDGVSSTAKPGDLILAYVQPQTSPEKWLLARIVGLAREPNPTDGGPPRTSLNLAPQGLVTAPAALKGTTFQNRVLILGQRAAAFGATAPDPQLMSAAVQTTLNLTGTPPDWTNLKMDPAGTATGGTLDLDAIYPDAMVGRAVLFSAAGASASPDLGVITAAADGGRKDFGTAAKVTRIGVADIDLTDATGFNAKVRQTAIVIETGQERLLTPALDISTPAGAPDRLVVQGKVTLPIGRRLVLTGQAWTAVNGVRPVISEVVVLKALTSTASETELVFERPVVSRFRSTTLTVLANAVGASQGSTQINGPEIIGSGKAASPSPRFKLKGAPLAYVPAANPRGYAPAIEVRVGDRAYAEHASLFGLESEDWAFAVRGVRDGQFEVQFAGRLPSGAHNVTADYRVGGGAAGNLPTGKLTMIMNPIVGVSGVVNATPAEGGSDAETLEDMRVAAPQSIRTLDRAVSLADIQAFAAAYRGIGKALATELHAGMRSVVCLTIATTDLAPPTPGSDILDTLTKALKAATPPGLTLRIEGFVELSAQVTVGLAIDPSYRRADIEAKVRKALGETFGRRVRDFGQALHRSAVLAVVQGVEGVMAARLATFLLPGGPAESEGRLLCPGPTLVDGVFSKAGLLSIDPNQTQFVEMAP